jgi:hypothetical protein
MSLSRFEVPLTAPSVSFNILIPVTLSAVQTDTNFYVAYQTTNTTNSYKSVGYVEAKRLISLTNSIGMSGSFGLQVSGKSVGATVTGMTMKANNGGSLTVNSGNNIGAGFSYFSEWDYFNTTTAASITGWTTYGTCVMLKYLYYYTNYANYLTGSTFSSSYKFITGIVCHCDSSGSISSAILTIPTVYLPSKWGLVEPGYGAISEYQGKLVNYNTNSAYQTIGTSLTVSGITFPAFGPSMMKAVGSFQIPLPVGL